MKKLTGLTILLLLLLGCFSTPAFAQGNFVNDFIHEKYIQYVAKKATSSELGLKFGIEPEELVESFKFVETIIEKEKSFTNAILFGTQEQALEAFDKLTEMYGSTPEFKDLIIKAIKLFYQAETEEDYEMVFTTLNQEIKGIENQEWQWRRDIFAAMLTSSVIKLRG